MTEENFYRGPLALDDIIESDLAVEPDAKVAEEIRMLPEGKQTSDNEETAYAAVKMPFAEYIINSRNNNSSNINRRRVHKENSALINVSKQLDKQAAEIKRMNSILQSVQMYTKPLGVQRQLIKQLQSQIKQIRRQTSQVQKYVTRKNNTNKNKNTI